MENVNICSFSHVPFSVNSRTLTWFNPVVFMRSKWPACTVETNTQLPDSSMRLCQRHAPTSAPQSAEPLLLVDAREVKLNIVCKFYMIRGTNLCLCEQVGKNDMNVEFHHCSNITTWNNDLTRTSFSIPGQSPACVCQQERNSLNDTGHLQLLAH